MYTEPKDLIGIKECAKLVKLKPSTIYKHSSRLSIPVIKKDNRIWFSVSELNTYFLPQRRKQVI
jgi:predicted DNA-binding transcriptional regulator AlpA